jgi:hypothetical protein
MGFWRRTLGPITSLLTAPVELLSTKFFRQPQYNFDEARLHIHRKLLYELYDFFRIFAGLWYFRCSRLTKKLCTFNVTNHIRVAGERETR